MCCKLVGVKVNIKKSQSKIKIDMSELYCRKYLTRTTIERSHTSWTHRIFSWIIRTFIRKHFASSRHLQAFMIIWCFSIFCPFFYCLGYSPIQWILCHSDRASKKTIWKSNKLLTRKSWRSIKYLVATYLRSFRIKINMYSLSSNQNIGRNQWHLFHKIGNSFKKKHFIDLYCDLL